MVNSHVLWLIYYFFNFSLTKDYLNNLYASELQHFLGRYKFVLAFENGVCDDYITEKFWRPLLVGSIPIYFGSPTARVSFVMKVIIFFLSE